jgi:Protein of unknown function (DUF3054)
MSTMARRPRVRRSAVVLALGDAATIILFVGLGLVGHGEGITPGGIARTAVPVLIAWFVVAPFAGTYRRPGLRSLAVTWLPAVAAGVLVRSAIVGHPTGWALATFVAIALAVTLAMLLAWRALASLLPRASRGSEPAGRADAEAA